MEHVQLGLLTRGQKPLVPLAYRDGDLHFPSLSLFLPPLRVISYEPTTGKLVLSLAESKESLSKLQTFQDMVLMAIHSSFRTWFPGAQRRPQDIRAGFQPMIQSGGEIHLYYPMNDSVAQASPTYQGTPLKAGSMVRIALRIYGISFHIHPMTGQWTGKFRLQHKILGVFCGGTGQSEPS